ncbi:lipase family protein [Leptothoe spongobia]|uniref:Lipase family protein n=1 Tax=Leptothoe spongobia TAU-MAC 1115 TaxID=1967444 RepID=A0A947DIE5_9CYAN|nr:lipase family protein [Leptothoe spongobia]MBT9317797.1 lipase family protein [Leptothoe spongobia TAU-MAC 1115]
MRRSVNIRSISTKVALSLLGSVLLIGGAPHGTRVDANLAINQPEPAETGILPLLEDEITPLIELADPNDVNKQRQQFLFVQGLFAVAVGLSSLALVHGVRSYGKRHKQQQLEFLRHVTREFENDPDIAQALKILDFEEYRSYQDGCNHGIATQATTFNVTDDLLSRALADDESRQYQRALLEKLSPDAENYESAVSNYYAETTVRDWFNKMLNSIEHFSHLVEAKVFTVKEVKPWLLYWVRLIADEKYRRNHDSRIYNQLYNYIHDHGFNGVKELFERFGYRILRTPYQEDDFYQLKDFHHYNTGLALSMAKTSMLVYQDIRYVLEILELWGIKDTRDDFQYFNDKEYDTQAFIFRTDNCIVLAFRGSQEIRDWYTNFSTKLRKFTIRREGQTTISSYKGRVHTGFFLGWASVEKGVLAQIKNWQNELNPGEALPPLLITGHSLGGALATMAAASLQDNNISVAGLYTFGQPRVGDRSFTRQLNANLVGKVFRFINNNDVVPHVPPPFSLRSPTRLYAHLGTVKYFNSKGSLVTNYKILSRALDGLIGLVKSLFESGFDLISDHSMSYYISYLAKAMDEEKQDRVATKLETDVNRSGGGPDNATAPVKKSV